MKKLLFPLLCATQVCVALPMLAQTDRATMTGTVTDTTGARVPSVDITITSKSTGIVRHTTSNSEGLFAVSSLTTGTYTVIFRRTTSPRSRSMTFVLTLVKRTPCPSGSTSITLPQK